MSFIIQCCRALRRRPQSAWPDRRLAVHILACLFGSWLVLSMAPVRATPLSLREAEAQLTRDNPSLGAAAQRITALQHRAVAATQLPDPQLSLDAVNLPTDSFSLTQQGMTMLSMGVSQDFPPIGKLGLEGDELHAKAKGQRYSREAKRAELILALRQAWLSAVYARQAVDTVRRQQDLARENVKAATAGYRSGTDPQSDVLRARLATQELRNDESTLAADESATLARIARYLGVDQVPEIVPTWPELPRPPSDIRTRLSAHPVLRETQAQVKAARIGVQLAKKNFLPSVTVGASYGESFFPGSPNYFSAGVSMNLPIFSRRRLDQELDSARAQVMEARYREQDQRLALMQQVRAASTRYDSLHEKWGRATTQILPLANAAFNATLAAYSSGRATMSAVLKAQQEVFADELQTIRYRRDLLAAQAKLDYLTTSSQEQP